MTQATIRTAIYNVVNATTNAGQVYDYARFSASWDDFLDQFKTTIGGTPQIRGWQVSYAGFAEPPIKQYVGPATAGKNSLTARAHMFKVFGYMSLDDSASSEKTFAALAETVVNDLDDDATLHDDSTYLECSPASIDFYGTIVLGSVLCNYAEISITVTEATEI